MKRWIWLQICARRFFTRYNVWTISMRLHYDFHGGVNFFCMVIDFHLIVVMPKCLAARSPVARCIHFCIRSQLNWGSLIAATIFSGNGAFKSEFWCQKQTFWWNTWTCLQYLTQSSLVVMTWYHIGKHSALSSGSTSLEVFTPLRVGWPPTPQVYFGPWEGLRVVFPRGGSPS